ncbi:NDR1/HIN1-like protein 2 [Mercurialis annua]|uniref:NDR1/HIN1-like protein 2 n=1 Tax=Mercurialis annua TaxID=3986 RepID=UPI00215F45FA|nr:NDR1/HIN1-like protein 2 [Mercurialis annua]
MAYPNTRPTRPTFLHAAIICTTIFFTALIVLILWLSLRPHPPKFHIHDFIVTGSGQPNGLQNIRITFNVTVRNRNPRIGIYYDSFTGSVFYKDLLIGSTRLSDPFYQGPKHTGLIFHVLPLSPLTTNNQRWMEFADDLAKGMVGLRLELISTVRYKTKLWDTKRHRMHPKCDVMVGSDGLILPSYKGRKCPT